MLVEAIDRFTKRRQLADNRRDGCSFLRPQNRDPGAGLVALPERLDDLAVAGKPV